jgi:transglutaminase-like putative cysteine protease
MSSFNMATAPHRRKILVTLALIAIVVCGCHVEANPKATSSTQSESNRDSASEKKNSSQSNSASSESKKTAQGVRELIVAAKLAPNPPGEVRTDRWMMNSIDGRWAGWTHQVDTEEEVDGQVRLHTLSETELLVNRSGEEHVQRLSIHSIANKKSEMLGLEMRLPGNTVEVEPRDDKWIAHITVAGKTIPKPLPIEGKHLDANAPERSLAEKPLVPGEKRTVRHFIPTTNQIGETQYVAEDLEDVTFPGGSERLLKATSRMVLTTGTQESTVWCDETGQIRKSLVSGLRLETIETSPEIALRKPAGELYDLGLATIVKVDRFLSNTQTASRFTFKAKLKESAIDGLFVNDASQKVEVLSKREARITIIRVRPDEPKELLSENKSPSDADKAAGTMIQSDDVGIQAFAASIANGESDPWKFALKAELAVRRIIEKHDYSQAFSSATEVLRDRQGDCTEHAVLFAAACRARGIPARVAAGLVYVPSSQGFAYHMWNEVWIADRWVPMDATRPGGMGVDHIKLVVTNLNDTDPMAAMLPVINVIGQLEIEVESVDP